LSSSFTARFPNLPLSSKREGDVLRSLPAQHDPQESDCAELIAQIAVGEREAMSRLFHRFARPVRAVGRRILQNDAEADDLVQEVFLYIHRKARLFDRSKGGAQSWIFQVAYTQAFIRRRQLKSIGFYASGIADTALENGSATNPGADYDQTVEALFGRSGWKQVLDSLTHEQKETLRLHFYEGYTFAEIAEKLGQSYANVRHHHYRGLEKLRKRLTDDGLSRR
jgi:RNA polymerase sigma-70 factor (ECF subfamily)